MKFVPIVILISLASCARLHCYDAAEAKYQETARRCRENGVELLSECEEEPAAFRQLKLDQEACE